MLAIDNNENENTSENFQNLNQLQLMAHSSNLNFEPSKSTFSQDEFSDQLANLSLKVNNNLKLKIVENNNVSTQPNDLPNDIDLLKNMLEMRVKYTRPKHGEYWEFNNIPNDVNYLQECIRFIDTHCVKNEENNVRDNSKYYNKYLEPLEMTAKELDLEFGTRFYNHFSFKFLRNELNKYILNSKYDYLNNILVKNRKKGMTINKEWIIYPNNKLLNDYDYIKFYDKMDDVFKEWILEYCISNKYIYNLCINSKKNTFQILEIIVNEQNISFQIKLLIDVLIENLGSEEYLNNNSGYLTYLTYVEHLQYAIESSIPKCENPYKTAMLLIIVFKGMRKFPNLLNEFQIKLQEFLTLYPNFTLGQLANYLKDNNMPDVGGFQRITN
jgi:hypothetical protein